MDLFTQIKEAYPEISNSEFAEGSIRLQDDGDGIAYIAKWEYSQPIPQDLTLGKPST